MGTYRPATPAGSYHFSDGSFLQKKLHEGGGFLECKLMGERGL